MKPSPSPAANALAASLRRGAFAVVLALTASAMTPASACGFEDPSSIAALRGSLNLAYPDSLHVGTAVWQEQLAGRLPRDPLAQRAELTPEARGALRLLRANAVLRQFAARVSASDSTTAHPNLAVVLLGPVMWSRFESGGEALKATLHVPGPKPGDVVIVTDIAVFEAIGEGTLRVRDALELGVMRLYGQGASVATARDWLTASDRG